MIAIYHAELNGSASISTARTIIDIMNVASKLSSTARHFVSLYEGQTQIDMRNRAEGRYATIDVATSRAEVEVDYSDNNPRVKIFGPEKKVLETKSRLLKLMEREKLTLI